MEQKHTPTRLPTSISKLLTSWEPFAHATTEDGLTFIVAPYRIPTEEERREGMPIDLYIGREDRCSWVKGTLTGRKDGSYITFSHNGKHCELYVDQQNAVLQRDGRLPEKLRNYTVIREEEHELEYA